ncbi:MAG: TCP-1/cpn60 chaperonin family protein, partial [Bacilli bacterium]
MNINTYTNPTETRNIVEEVLDAAREAVVSTMGPNGKLACIIEINEPIVTKDGVRVAKSLDFNDPRKNSIAKLITSAAIRTDDIVGDGTTTTTLMIHELYNKFSPYNNFLDMKFIDEKIKEVKEFLLSKV